MRRPSKIILFFTVLILMIPSAGLAHRVGEYIPLNASVTPDIMTGSEVSESEDYQFEGSNVTDTEIDDSGTELIGYGEFNYPVTVSFAGDITDISSDQYPDIFQYEQELLIDGSEISKLFQLYKAGLQTLDTPSQFESEWQNIVDGYADTISGLTDSINIRQLATQRLSGTRLADILSHIPDLFVTGDLTVHVDINTDPTNDGDHLKDIFSMMMEIGMENWETAQKAAEDAKALISGRAYAGTQIVGRPDLYGKSSYNGDSTFNYEGNVLTIYVWSRGSMSSYGGITIASNYEWDEESGHGRIVYLHSTEEAREAGLDTYGKAFEEYKIPATAENINRLKQLEEELDDMSSGNNWFSLSYMKALTAIAVAFPEYNKSSAWDAFLQAELENEESDPYHQHGHYMAEVSIDRPKTKGLVTDYDLSKSTAVTFDAAIDLIMPDTYLYDYQPEPEYADPTDLHASPEYRQHADRVDEFISKYIIGAGYECLTQSELTDEYSWDAYEPNNEIYEIDGKYTGTFGDVCRLVVGDIPAYNKLTGSTEDICHASESLYDYICFCAGTNGWVRIKNGNGDVRFIRYEDFLKAANAAAEDSGLGPDLISDCYMVCAGENHNKGHVLELRLDTNQIAENVFRQLTINDLRELLGDHEIALRDLVDLVTGGFDFNIQDGHIIEGFDETVSRTEDWWLDILRELLEELDGDSGSDLKGDGDPDGDSGSGDTGDNQHGGDGTDGGGSGHSGKFRFTMEEFIRWLIEQGYISEGESSEHTQEDEIRWMTDYFPEYLSHYSGVVVFSVDRVITKQLKNTTSRSTSRFQNVGFPEGGGSHKWVVTTNGFSSLPYYGGSQSGVTLAAGTTSVSASEAVRQIYEDAVTYDYTEEWILEPFGYVIFRKTVSGELAGVDGQTHDVNTVYFSTTLGPVTEIPAGDWTFITEEDEFGQAYHQGEDGTVPFGTITMYSITGGYWINGIPSADYSVSQLSVSTADGSAYCYRIQ